MMTTELRQTMERWLGAERSGDDARAAEAFGRTIRGLPRLAPSADFAARVLAAAVPVPVRRSAIEAWWGWKVTITAALALAGLMVGSLPSLRPLVAVPGWGDVVSAGASTLAWLADWTAVGFAVWDSFVRIGRAAAAAADTPEVALALAASAVLATGALYTLRVLLLEPERRLVR